MKKIFKIVSMVTLILTLITQSIYAESKNFTDLNKSYWAYESIKKLSDSGVINGYPDGNFRPDGYITRAELVKLTNIVFSYTSQLESSNLTDIKPHEWYYDYVLAAQSAGYINGYEDGSFRPDSFVTRQELCKILDVINGFIELPFNKSIADKVDPWAEGYVKRVISNRIMSLDEKNNFRAIEKATRAEVCDALAKFILVLEPNNPDIPPISGGGGIGNEVPSVDDNLKLMATMDKVIKRLNSGVIPNLSSELQKEIVNDIITSMEGYKKDNNFDYEHAAGVTYEKYKLLSEDEQNELKVLIQLKNTTGDLLDLQEFFFPDIKL